MPSLLGTMKLFIVSGAWLIGVLALLGLVAGWAQCCPRSLYCQGFIGDLRRMPSVNQTFSYANIEQFNAGNLVVRMTK